jgi:hypothetical protein
MKDFKEYTIYDAVTPQAVTSSTDATPIVVTKTSHGFSTGDLVVINGHTTNIAANGIFKITVLSSSTFSLQDINTGADVAGSGAGAGASGVMVKAPKIIFCSDYLNCMINIDTSGSFNGTFKVAGSIGKPASAASAQHGDTPNFGATQTASNPYSFIQIINLATAAAVDGATGITSAGTDLHNNYEVNINGLKYFTVIPTAWTAGTITIKAQLFNNE